MRAAIAIIATAVWVIAPRHVGDRAPTAERAASNDNRRPAGTLRDGVLSMHLEVREADWRPDGDDSPGIVCARSRSAASRRASRGR
jgi:hypothetical protein